MNEDNQLRRVLDRYFSQEIQLKQAKKQEALGVWEPIVRDVLRYVISRDERFRLKVFPSGSYYEKTKVKEPNEFDIMLEMEKLSLGQWSPYDGDEDDLADDPPLGYTTVMIDQGEEETWMRDGCIDPRRKLLSSTNIKSKFARLVNDAIRDPEFQARHRCLQHINVTSSGPAVTLGISHAYLDGCISIDLTLAIYDASWPDDGEDWKRRQRNGWPSQMLVREIVDGGCHLVAKKPKDSSNRDADFFWRYSFSRAEKKLFNEGSSGAAGTCRRHLLRILKSLREDLRLTPLTTYHLKAIVLHEYEAYPRDTDWGTNQMPARFKSALRRLLSCLREKRCPHFFIQDLNLFESRSFNDQRFQFLIVNVENLLTNPISVIGNLLEK